MEISPIAGSFLFTPIPGYRGALESVIIPTSEGRPRDASTAMMAGETKRSYIWCMVSRRLRAWTGAFNVPYTLKGQLCSVRKLPVRGPRASPVARSVPMHKTTVLSEGCPLSARKSDILVESARQAECHWIKIFCLSLLLFYHINTLPVFYSIEYFQDYQSFTIDS